MQKTFLEYQQLKEYNNQIQRVMFESEEKPVEVPYDPNRFQSIIAGPEDIDDDVIYLLADLIDKKTNLDEKDYTTDDIKGPNTADKLMNSLAIAFITENELPVAVATLIDPTVENYKGFIPSDYYELKTGTSLENRLQQEFYVVKDELDGYGLSGELRRLLDSVTPDMFVTVLASDKKTIRGLQNNGYKFIAQFDTSWDIEPVQLWID